MTTIEIAERVTEDLTRILEHLVQYKVENPENPVGAIIAGIRVLKENPLIGRAISGDARELVIGRDRRGYVALYDYDRASDRVLVLAIRSQREAGYADSEFESR